VVADFGCGDARLARSIPNKVHSFDLVAVSREVTACNMAHTPLSSASVDIVVFCLSLMGTDLGAYLTEASRVLKEGSVLCEISTQSF
jgi:ribosomal RNA-processing protein 8